MIVERKPNMRQIISAGVIAIAVVLLTQATGLAKIPEPDNIIYGIAGNDAVTIALKVDGEPITSYTMGDNPDAGLFYILRVPMDSLAPFEPGKVRIGDEAFVYINDEIEPVASVVLGGGEISTDWIWKLRMMTETIFPMNGNSKSPMPTPVMNMSIRTK